MLEPTADQHAYPRGEVQWMNKLRPRTCNPARRSSSDAKPLMLFSTAVLANTGGETEAVRLQNVPKVASVCSWEGYVMSQALTL